MINEFYLIPENIVSIHEHFNQNNPKSVILKDFFTIDFMNLLNNELKNLSFVKLKNPVKYSYQISDFPFLQDKMNSKDFIDLIEKITNYKVNGFDFKIIELTWKDYKIIHDEEVESPGIDIIVDMTNSWKDIFGGNVVYVDMNGDYLEIPSSYGLLAIVKREETDHKYIKYVNNLSRKVGSRFIAVGNFD